MQSSPSTLALDLAHVLAFRAPGLGSSLFASGHKPLTHTDVANFAHSVFTAGNVAILGTGIGQSELQSLVEKYLVKGDSSLAQGAGPQTRAAKYYGGETWIDSHYDTPTLFIGFGASGAPSSALATLAEILTPAPSVKWASGTSPISAFVPAGATVEVIHLPYTDAALFGYLVTAKNSADIKVAAQAAVKALKDAAGSSGIKSEDLKKGIAKAKFTAASSIDTREGLVSVLGSKVLSGGEASAESLIKSLDSVSNAAVSKVSSVQNYPDIHNNVLIISIGCFIPSQRQTHLRRNRRRLLVASPRRAWPVKHTIHTWHPSLNPEYSVLFQAAKHKLLFLFMQVNIMRR